VATARVYEYWTATRSAARRAGANRETNSTGPWADRGWRACSSNGRAGRDRAHGIVRLRESCAAVDRATHSTRFPAATAGRPPRRLLRDAARPRHRSGPAVAMRPIRQSLLGPQRFPEVVGQLLKMCTLVGILNPLTAGREQPQAVLEDAELGRRLLHRFQLL